MNTYATTDEVQRYLRIDEGDTALNQAIGALIYPLSAVIDGYAHTNFYGVTATRRYDFQDPWRLDLYRQLSSLTTLTNGDGATLTIDADFYLYPSDGFPYTSIEIRRDVGKVFSWSGTPQRCISVTGVWGDNREESREIARVALCAWIGYILSASENPGVSSLSIGSFSVAYTGMADTLKTMPGEVKAMLAPIVYRSVRS